jgi:hypothetical protein
MVGSTLFGVGSWVFSMANFILVIFSYGSLQFVVKRCWFMLAHQNSSLSINFRHWFINIKSGQRLNHLGSTRPTAFFVWFTKLTH